MIFRISFTNLRILLTRMFTRASYMHIIITCARVRDQKFALSLKKSCFILRNLMLLIICQSEREREWMKIKKKNMIRKHTFSRDKRCIKACSNSMGIMTVISSCRYNQTMNCKRQLLFSKKIMIVDNYKGCCNRKGTKVTFHFKIVHRSWGQFISYFTFFLNFFFLSLYMYIYTNRGTQSNTRRS